MNSVPVQTLAAEIIEDGGLDHAGPGDQTIVRWITDAVDMVPTQQSLVHRLAYVPVANYGADAPEDFRILQQVVGRPEVVPAACGYRRERLSQWTVGTSDPDTELEVKVKCRRCKTSRGCTCATPTIEVDADRLWEMAHPESYMKRYYRAVQVGEGPGIGQADQGWKLLRYAQGDFFRTKYFLDDSPNLMSEEAAAFSIERGRINTSFGKGELILSYLGHPVDDDGNVLIDNHPDLLEAVKAHVMYKWFTKLYYKSIGGKTENSAQYNQARIGARQEREDAFRLYRSATEIPEFKEFRNFIQQVWNQRIPDPHWDENANIPLTRDLMAQRGKVFK